MITTLIEHVTRQHIALQAGAARLRARTDGEALHDMRIAVRRLRSLLRPLRSLTPFAALEAAAAAFGQKSTPLRDSEVLLEELRRRGHIRLSTRRKALERGYDTVLAGPELALLLKTLDAWPATLRLAAWHGELGDLAPYIRKRLIRQQRGLAKALRDPEHDRHRLRVLIKRVRYAAEAYPALAALPKPAARQLKAAQAALGDWHDHLQWLHRAETEKDLQPLCESWRRALIAAERRADPALQPLREVFSEQG
jgi:CHAD domain-containing protein